MSYRSDEFYKITSVDRAKRSPNTVISVESGNLAYARIYFSDDLLKISKFRLDYNNLDMYVDLYLYLPNESFEFENDKWYVRVLDCSLISFFDLVDDEYIEFEFIPPKRQRKKVSY